MDMALSTMMPMDMGNSTMHDHGNMGNSTMHDHHNMGNSTMHDHHNMGNSTMDHGDHGGMDHSAMMQMWFYFGITNVTILFESWKINTVGQMVGACIGVAILAALYEGLKVMREVILRKMSAQRRRNTSDPDYQNGVALMNSTALVTPPRSTIWSSWHLLQTFLHLVQVTISYALMLIFMTYNGYLAIAILIGAFFGYFVFGWKKAVIIDINEHCH